MKTLKCYDCDLEFHSETKEDILNQMYAHYMSSHNEIITGANEAEKESWMKRFNEDWANID